MAKTRIGSVGRTSLTHLFLSLLQTARAKSASSEPIFRADNGRLGHGDRHIRRFAIIGEDIRQKTQIQNRRQSGTDSVGLSQRILVPICMLSIIGLVVEELSAGEDRRQDSSGRTRIVAGNACIPPLFGSTSIPFAKSKSICIRVRH